MRVEIEVEDQLETLLLVEALQDKKEDEESMNCEAGVEACENLLDQMDWTIAHRVIVGGGEE